MSDSDHAANTAAPTPATSGPEFLRAILGAGLQRTGARRLGRPVIGPRGDSIGCRVAHRDNGEAWLRVAPFRPESMDREWFTGNADANILSGVRRPQVLHRIEWTAQGIEVGADLMTYVPDRPLAAERDLLSSAVHLPGRWYADLRASLDALASHRRDYDLSHLQRGYDKRIAECFGALVEPYTPTMRTEHTDLQWSNLTGPDLWILDWEHWGTAMAGLGPASLYCTALLVPKVAERIHDTFADILDTADGRYAQLAIIADRLDYNEPNDEEGELHQRLRRLAGRLL